MSLISSVTNAAAALASGLDPVTILAAGQPKGPAAVAGAKSGTAKGTTTKASTAKAATAKAATSKASTAKAATAKAATAKAGYASASADFAFLKDRTLSVEEKLFRFMCAIAQRNDDEVLQKMEEMKGGTAKAAASGGSSSSGGSKKSSGVSVRARSSWRCRSSAWPPR